MRVSKKRMEEASRKIQARQIEEACNSLDQLRYCKDEMVGNVLRDDELAIVVEAARGYVAALLDEKGEA